jgi:hypothetical protein
LPHCRPLLRLETVDQLAQGVLARGSHCFGEPHPPPGPAMALASHASASARSASINLSQSRSDGLVITPIHRATAPGQARRQHQVIRSG